MEGGSFHGGGIAEMNTKLNTCGVLCVSGDRISRSSPSIPSMGAESFGKEIGVVVGKF